MSDINTTLTNLNNLRGSRLENQVRTALEPHSNDFILSLIREQLIDVREANAACLHLKAILTAMNSVLDERKADEVVA